MGTIFYIGVFSALVSILGTLIGATLGVMLKNPSKRLMGSILGAATGIMISIIFLELIPEAIEYNGFLKTLLVILIGISLILIIDVLSRRAGKNNDSHLKVAILMGLAMMIHNFPEGLVMGFGFLKESNLGIKMAALISIHDVPEGLAVATPLVVSGMKPRKILTYAFWVAFPTMIGAWLGIIIGSISKVVLGTSIAFASGVMIYVVFGQMLPESNSLTDSFTTSITTILGIIIGFIMLNIL
ncbi:ZIP family metal transporter [Clostridium ihumii]|uniref:ZIP family metal transporter n=1 Tax=Clostridium ihumii TaxID=1470356 RepID=UPI0005550665|nr:ZIP family metal transporter [Clostridium ihumii]